MPPNLRPSSLTTVYGTLLVILAVMQGASRVSAQVAQSPTYPKYPRTNLATGYQVDPGWPQRPSQIQWGAVSGVAVDGQDQVWVYTRAIPPVQVYDSSGKFLRAWGEGVINNAHHVKFDPQGNVWLSDIGNHTVMQFTPEGKLLKTLGTKGVAGEDATHLNQPTDMAISPTGEIFVSDGYANSRVVHFDKTGKFVKAWGKLGTKPGEFSLPHSIVMDSKGRLYVADRNNVRIQVFDQKGKYLEQWANVIVPWGLSITKADEIWVCGSSPMQWRDQGTFLGIPPKDQVFMKFNTSGKLLQFWGVPIGQVGQEQPGECDWVHTIATDSKGNLYVGDIRGKRAQKFVRKE